MRHFKSATAQSWGCLQGSGQAWCGLGCYQGDFWSFSWAVLVKIVEARVRGSVYGYFFPVSPSLGAVPSCTTSLTRPHVLLLQQCWHNFVVLTFPHSIISLWSGTGLQCRARGIPPLTTAGEVSWRSTAVSGWAVSRLLNFFFLPYKTGRLPPSCLLTFGPC